MSGSTDATDRFDLKTLYETSNLLSGSLDKAFVLENVLLMSMTKLMVSRGAVFMLDDPDHSAIEKKRDSGASPIPQRYELVNAKGPLPWSPGDRVEFSSSFFGSFIQGDSLPKTLKDAKFDFLWEFDFQNRHMGFLALGRKMNGQPVGNHEIEFMTSMVNIAATSLHNSLVVGELRHSNRSLDSKLQELNTLFDLSREFNATRDRPLLVRLMSFALMGQMLVQKHIFLLKRASDAESEDEDNQLRIVKSQGVDPSEIHQDILGELVKLDDLVDLTNSKSMNYASALHDLGLIKALPLKVRGATEGVLVLGPKMTGKEYTPDDIDFVRALGSLALSAVQNSFLLDEQLEKERLAGEIQLAREIQEKLLPSSIPRASNLDVGAFATPSKEISGDYFDVITLDEERILIAIADVTGKGVPASLLMANIQACIRILVPSNVSLEMATKDINNVIHSNTGFDKFITFFWGIFNTGTRKLTYVNAGHDQPFMIRANGKVERLETGGLLLGVLPGAEYELGEVQIEKDDVVCLYTDGVPEAQNFKQEEYGEDRLEEVLLKKKECCPNDIVDAVRESVKVYVGDAPQIDDITLVVVKGE